MSILRPFLSAFVVVVVLGISLNGVGAQVAVPPTPPQPPAKEVIEKTPLKVTVVLSRWQGEKRITNLPFTLYVNTQDSTSVRMQSDVPIPTTVMTTADDKPSTPVTSMQYRSLGTSIDVSGRVTSGTPPGRFSIYVTVADSQLSTQTSGSRPIITSFTSQAQLLLRDGETQQFTTATDKTTGDVVKVDVTLNVLK